MYRNCFWDQSERVIKLRTWDADGNRCTRSINFKPYLYIDSPRGQYTSIFDTKVERVEFDTPGKRIAFVKGYGSNRFYENFDTTQQFLLDTFWNQYDKPGFDKNPLRIIFFDIEVDETKDGSFPEADRAPSEINIITAYDSLEEKYYVFSKKPYTGNSLGDNVVYKNCITEKGILLSFIEFWQSNEYPDIVTAWNLNRFDMPYIVNRIRRVLGAKVLPSLSPYNGFYESIERDKMKREYTKYNFSGIQIIDHIDVYTKYKITKQESYKLDYIAQQELGIGKVDYQGESNIFSFMNKHWNTFVEYNVRDVELLVKLEEKTHYFKILRMVSYMGCCNFDKGLMTIPVTNGCVAVRCRQKNRILHTFIRDNDKDEEKPGGFVSLKPGFAKNLMTCDAGSLYPNTAISLNISPETKVGMAYFEGKNVYYGPDDEKVKIVLSKQKTKYHLTRSQFVKFIHEMDYCVAPNGCIFKQKVQGVFPQFMSEVFERRSNIRAKIKELNKENEKLEKEKSFDNKEKIKANNKELVAMDILQYALKILINSAYGAISSPKNPIGDTDLANAITTTGSTSIKQVNVFAMDFIKSKNPNISQKDLENVVIFNDTDSCCICLTQTGVEVCKDGKVTEEGYKIVEECDDYINQHFDKWFKNITNSNKCTIYFKREKICDAGIFLKKKDSNEEAKKNYILHILDNEGVKKPKFKYTGVKFARSTLTNELKTAAKEVIEHMILTQDKFSTDNMLQNLYMKFKEMPLNSIVSIQRCNNISKFQDNIKDVDNNKLSGIEWQTGTPGHIRAAIYFNIIIDKLNIKGCEKIKSGELAKIIYVHKNKFDIDKIAFLDEWPKEFDEYFQIDYKTTFIKTVYDEIKRIYNSVDWVPFNPSDDYGANIFDILSEI